MDLPSKLLEKTVEYFESLPGVGKRTALRYALHLLKMQKEQAQAFGASISKLSQELKFCKVCHNVSDNQVCQICAHPKRNQDLICVVEDLRDLLAIEGTGQFYGVYHVLGGVISPMDGVGPSELNIESLVSRIETGNTKELLFALPATTEGDTTCFYIFKKLKAVEIKITSLARGVAVGNELQYTDEVTLGRSILARLPFETSLRSH